MMRWPDVGAALGDILWAVAGAVATRLYMPERATQHLDIVIRTRDAAAAYGRLESAGYGRRGELAIAGTSWESPDGVAVDVMALDDSWTEALTRAAANCDRHGIPILPLPYLVLMKVVAARNHDLGDVARMLGLAPDDALDAVRAMIRERAPDLLEDVESLISLGQLEWREP